MVLEEARIVRPQPVSSLVPGLPLLVAGGVAGRHGGVQELPIEEVLFGQVRTRKPRLCNLRPGRGQPGADLPDGGLACR